MADLPEVKIKRRPDGTRYVQPYLGRSKVTGRAIRPYKSFPDDMTDEQVEDAARRWLATVGAAIELGTTVKLGELLEAYVDSIEGSGGRANTVRSYRAWTKSYAAPIASMDARAVTTWMVERLYGELLANGGRDKGPLSARTVRSFAWFLSGAFRWLMQLGVCESNPCAGARVPVPGIAEAVALDEDSMGAIVPALRQEMAEVTTGARAAMRRCAAFLAWMSLHTGIRVGEACALRRADVQRRAVLHVCGTVVEAAGRVERQPATKGYRARNVSISPDVLAAALRHMEWEDEFLGRKGVSALGGLPLATINGGWLRPSSVSREFRLIARDYGLPADAPFHTLRHTHATWLLMAGADMKTVQERLGHADVATTMRIYGHVLPGRDQAMADIFSGVAERFSGHADEDG